MLPRHSSYMFLEHKSPKLASLCHQKYSCLCYSVYISTTSNTVLTPKFWASKGSVKKQIFKQNRCQIYPSVASNKKFMDFLLILIVLLFFFQVFIYSMAAQRAQWYLFTVYHRANGRPWVYCQCFLVEFCIILAAVDRLQDIPRNTFKFKSNIWS